MQETEVWKDVPRYEGHYQVSIFGKVKSIKFNKARLLMLRIDINGYLKVNLCINGKRQEAKIHKLMAITFLNHTHKKGIVVDHIDNNKLNNHVDNLQIITHRENGSKDQFRHNRSSKYAGVCFHKQSNTWFSRILINGKIKWLGNFENEIDAHLAYQKRLEEIK